MSNQKARKLSEVVDTTTMQGINDARWFLLEHQIYQVIVSLQSARQVCEMIGDRAENGDEWELARAALEELTPVYIDTLQMRQNVSQLMASSKIAERVGRVEE